MKRIIIVPATQAYEIENCWQCPKLERIDKPYGEHEQCCGHHALDLPVVRDHGIPEFCPDVVMGN